MAAITPGNVAPRFNLPTTNPPGSRQDLSAAIRDHKIVVLAFFKVSCPVCQFAFPFLERLHHSYPGVPIWGVSQDDIDATNAFARMYGVSFPMLLDESLQSTVEYDLTNVPTVFAVSQDGKIKQTIVGFAKKDLEQLNALMAQAAEAPVKPLFTDADEVPELKPG
jgi:cytochrome c biogenesis protein CcmG, thiol:disulfide interchange protein DsbE